jgi:DNA-binding MarR family transcriptional regulator
MLAGRQVLGGTMAREIDDDTVARLRMTLGRIARVLDRQSLDAAGQLSGTASGLTRTQLSVLSTVGRRGPLRAGDLAEIEGLNPTLLSRVIGKLSEAGLVRRLSDPGDARATLVEVTPAGAKEHQRIRAERSRLLRTGLESLPPADAQHVQDALPALEELFEHMRDACVGSSRRVREPHL